VIGALASISFVTVQRLARSDRAVRRLLRPVLVPGLVWGASTAAGQGVRVFSPRWALDALRHYTPMFALPFQIMPILALTGILAGVAWVELVTPRMRRTTSGVVVTAKDGDTQVSDYLARALADPSVRVVFRGSGDATWVDATGHTTSLSTEDPDRAVTVLRRDEVVLGAIEHDAALASQPETIELVVTAVALAIESERLVALANIRVEDARRLTARLVTSSDAAREQLRQALTAGPLRELAQIELALSDDGNLEPAAAQLKKVAAEVRHISHGLLPPGLADSGLRAALSEAAEVPDRRFADAVEITAYLAAVHDPEARLTYADDELSITLSSKPTDPIVLDRVTVLGGTVDGCTITLPSVSP
jgi:hypothetical protein